MAETSEQSSIYGFLKNPSMVDYEGHLAGVFFTSGCNFRCGFCQNASLLRKAQKGITWERLRSALQEFRAKWASAVVLTGGEPTIAPDIHDIVKVFRQSGFKVKLDTNGSCPDVVADLLPVVDHVAMDIKCSLDNYPSFVGFSEPEKIQQTVDLLKTADTPYEFRTTLIESYHTDEELHLMGKLAEGTPLYRLQPFVPQDDLPEERLRSEPRTSPERLREAATAMEKYAEQVSVQSGKEG